MVKKISLQTYDKKKIIADFLKAFKSLLKIYLLFNFQSINLKLQILY